MIIVLMGVSGSGKTTVGKALAADLGWPFCDADDYHPPANIARMNRGEPLSDADRRPWLEALAAVLGQLCAGGVSVVFACSALKHAYQEVLRFDGQCIVYVHLVGSPELIARRLAGRSGHFLDPKLLASQLAILEPPADAVTVEISPPPDVIAAEIRRRLDV